MVSLSNKRNHVIVFFFSDLSEIEGGDSFENKTRWIVDVRDLVDAILLVNEKHEEERRYICNAHTIKARDLTEKLKSIYPSYKYPSK